MNNLQLRIAESTGTIQSFTCPMTGQVKVPSYSVFIDDVSEEAALDAGVSPHHSHTPYL
jgi:hypothetical protein